MSTQPITVEQALETIRTTLRKFTADLDTHDFLQGCVAVINDSLHRQSETIKEQAAKIVSRESLIAEFEEKLKSKQE